MPHRRTARTCFATFAAFARFRIDAYPTLILIDPNARVVEARRGALRGPQLAKTLDLILPQD